MHYILFQSVVGVDTISLATCGSSGSSPTPSPTSSEGINPTPTPTPSEGNNPTSTPTPTPSEGINPNLDRPPLGFML